MFGWQAIFWLLAAFGRPRVERLLLLADLVAAPEALACGYLYEMAEASAIEALGHMPRLVPGDWENIKVTWPGDFALAERLLRTRA